MLTTQPLRGITGDPTGLVLPSQGQFQPGLQPPQMVLRPLIMQPTPTGIVPNPFGQIYSNAGLPVGYTGAMGMMSTGVSMQPPQSQPSPGLPQQIPAFQQPMAYSPVPTALPAQLTGHLHPQMFQLQAFQPQTPSFPQAQPQPFLSQVSFMQPSMTQSFGQPQMFNPTAVQYGGWSQGQHPQAGYQGQQWSGA